MSGTEKVIVKVMDIGGRVINTFEYNSDNDFKIGASLSPGMYFVECIYADHIETVKIIKQ